VNHTSPRPKIVTQPELQDTRFVFEDRQDAGRQLAEMLGAWRDSDALVLGIPAGGVPVAAEIARALNLPLDVAVASKVLLPWTTEAGYGAVAFDGSVWLNQDYLDHYGLDKATVEAGVQAAREKVERRVRRFRDDRPMPKLAGRPVILVDDGLAAGSTLRAAIRALRKAGADQLIVAVPTGHRQSVEAIADEVEAIYCPNIRGGLRYAVAEAYRNWYDVEESEVEAILREFNPD
jgi:predicted phosphoribosyltransferase